MCYCIRCTALVLLDVVGSGCGALLCRMVFSFSSHFAHDARSQQPKVCIRIAPFG